MMDEFKKTRDALDGLEKEQRRYRRKRTNLADWSNVDDKREHIKLYKRRLREAMLPRPKICPLCGEVKPNNGSWVVFDRNKMMMSSCELARTLSRCRKCACCRGCAVRHFWKPKR